MSLHTPSENGSARTPVTPRTIRAMRERGEPFACLATYDALTARLCEEAGVHVLLMGDSAAQVVLGHDSTIRMPLDVSIAMTAALKRGAPSTLVMADMPFMSYQASADDALVNAGRFMSEGLADIVKIEVDASFAPLVDRMTRAGIPVCAHIGLRPQSVSLIGGYAAQGRTDADADTIVRDAKALEASGAAMLLIEAVPAEVAERVIASTSIPVIGIGAGPAPHGQILVLHDLLGLTPWQPGFVRVEADLRSSVRESLSRWVARVSEREATPHRYTMKSRVAGEPKGNTPVSQPVVESGDADAGDAR
ncbi:MAG: 3-methyl-2-oxobutanoate hydroxymethyltransferase [Planctomycetota bacterium]